jgi:hypothetical protein
MPVARCACVTVLLLSGCGSTPSVPPEAAPAIVLDAADLPEDFVELGAGPDEGRLEPAPPGRRASWSVRYRRADPAATHGPMIVVSSVEVYADAAATDAALERALGEEAPPDAAPHAIELGEEGWAVTYEQPALPRVSVFHVVAWRRLNVVARLVVQGFDGSFALEDTEGLARAQDRKILRAGG